MTLRAFDQVPPPLADLEAQGYTHLRWSCAECGLECARGFQLLRIRGRLNKDSTVLSVGRQLRCPRCFHRTDPDVVRPSKGRSDIMNANSTAT
jgi:DNA-directed RNA polymerase subunit RPC12/RpoP